MAASTVQELKVPYRDQLLDESGFLSRAWQEFYKYLKIIIDPLGVEKSFNLLNNISNPKKIGGLVFDKDAVRSVILEYLIQRITSTTELIESGILILSYKPTSKEWRITSVSSNTPDDSGLDFNIIPEPFTATYDFTTQTWTKNNFQLINGVAVKLTTTGSLPTGYSLNTTYYVINAAANTFQLSKTLGGAVVTANTNNGSGTQTVNPNYPSGQVMYKSSNVGGTQQVFKLSLRTRTLSGKNEVWKDEP